MYLYKGDCVSQWYLDGGEVLVIRHYIACDVDQCSSEHCHKLHPLNVRVTHLTQNKAHDQTNHQGDLFSHIKQDLVEKRAKDVTHGSGKCFLHKLRLNRLWQVTIAHTQGSHWWSHRDSWPLTVTTRLTGKVRSMSPSSSTERV